MAQAVSPSMRARDRRTSRGLRLGELARAAGEKASQDAPGAACPAEPAEGKCPKHHLEKRPVLKHARKLRLSLLTRGRRLAVAIPLCVMLAGVATQVQAQSTWGGSVEVSTTSLTVPPGQSLTYHLRLTEPPTADGWWVVLRVDGGIRIDGCYKGFRWVPSVGWPYKPGNYDTWRGVTFWADEECGPAGTVTITHEVWDETTFCPWKGSPVTVDVGDAVDVEGSLSIGDATVEEGGTAEFEVTLEPPSSQTVTVAFATGDDTAQAGTDYESRSGTLRFTAGEITKKIRVPTVDDTFHESEERFTLTLSNPSVRPATGR